MIKIQEITDLINKEVNKLGFGDKPYELYEPIRYIMKLGGKRIRPLLTLMSYSVFKDDIPKIIKPAIAVEIFHNFTLAHDDIMDRAPLRRGNPTIHEKWNNNVAILSGDTMLIKAYEFLFSAENHYLKRVLQEFNQCAIKVCEGQQYDMNYETSNDVSVDEYLQMIKLKTATLLGFCVELGAILGGAQFETQNALKEFGKHIGVGFQLKDDLLDVYADQNKFGKQIGGDIVVNKKTFLLITALELADQEKKQSLNYWLSQKEFVPEEKVVNVKKIYDELEVNQIAVEKMNYYFDTAFKWLDDAQISQEKILPLKLYAEKFIQQVGKRRMD